jgi:uncharacterized protein YqjF (DUF2071 family)
MAMRIFLTARWSRLAVVNFLADPSLLAPLLPPGTEPDLFEGRTYLSLVAFLFLDTRIRGWAVPFHRDFEELNLRFYVRRRDGGEVRRGVVFIKEFVPRRAIAWVARTCFGEPYEALPMTHRHEANAVRYAWIRAGREMSLDLAVTEPFRALPPGGEAEFILEHYWGYTAVAGGRTSEYRVEHPPWRAAPAARCDLKIDPEALYGPRFAPALSVPPVSAYLAEGSEVAVREGRPI